MILVVRIADWHDEQLPATNILRLIYQGRFLHGNVTLGGESPVSNHMAAPATKWPSLTSRNAALNGHGPFWALASGMFVLAKLAKNYSFLYSMS